MSYILTPLPSEFFEIWKKSSSTDGEFTYSVGLILPHKYRMLQNYPKPLKIQGEVGVLMLLFEKERSFYRALNNQLSLFLLENDELNVNYFSLKNTSKYQLPGMILNGENKCIEKILNYNYVKNHNIHKINYFLERSQLST